MQALGLFYLAIRPNSKAQAHLMFFKNSPYQAPQDTYVEPAQPSPAHVQPYHFGLKLGPTKWICASLWIPSFIEA